MSKKPAENAKSSINTQNNTVKATPAAAKGNLLEAADDLDEEEYEYEEYEDEVDELEDSKCVFNPKEKTPERD